MTYETASEFVKHVPCLACGSSDANSLYSDGHTHCFACGVTEQGDSAATAPKERRVRPALTGEPRYLKSRNLSEAACRKFGYLVGANDTGTPCQIANYRDEAGSLVAQKLRYADKSFSVRILTGISGHKVPLFGAHLWARGGKRLVITEGEIDAITVAQAFGLSWPVVSIPNGASSAVKSIQANIEYVESFDEVVLCFDMDDPGREAAAACAAVLSPGKARIAELTAKDANEVWVAGGASQLTSAIWQAREWRPDGIVSLSDIRSRVLEPIKEGLPWAWEGITKATHGRYVGDVIGLGAGVGVGKTDWMLQQVAFDVTQLGLTVGVLFLEQGVGDTGRRLAGKVAGRRFHVPGDGWTVEELHATWDALEATGRLYLYDSFGAIDWDTIKGKIRYLHASLGCQVIYLDHLTALMAGADDERRALDKVMADLAGMAKGRFILHFVSHLTTPDGKPHEEGGRVQAKHFTGSRAIMRWAHLLVGLERDKNADDLEERQITTARMLKERLSGDSDGNTWRLRYDRATGRLVEELNGAGGAFTNEEGSRVDF